MSAGATVTFDTKDIEKTIKVLNKMGKSPQKAVTRAAGRAGTVMKRSVKGQVPIKSGALKKSIVRVGERSRRKGKKVYQVTFDRKMNEEVLALARAEPEAVWIGYDEEEPDYLRAAVKNKNIVIAFRRSRSEETKKALSENGRKHAANLRRGSEKPSK